MSGRTAVIALLLLSTLGTAAALPPPGLPGGDLPDAPASEHDVYAVEQGDTCVAVKPIQGNENVVRFYDYRNPYTEPSDWSYSSFAPSSLTRENGSTMFLYEAPDGVVSLVILHDRRRAGRTGENLPMSAVSFRFDGLPESGRWVLMDDTYEGREDRWSRNRIDWTWTGSRIDGAVFRGLSGDFRTTVSPSWNEDAALHDPRFGSEPVNSWTFLSGSASDPTETDLDMGAPVTVHPGGCGAPPEAALSVRGAGGVGTGESVTFDASGTSDPDGDVAAYRWDFDGDGTVDQTTNESTVDHAYETPGERTARVTVVDGEGQTDEANATVRVAEGTTDGRSSTTSNGRTSGSADESTDGGVTLEPNALPGTDVLVEHPEWTTVGVALALLAGAVAARR
ncbi:PKD domain-containing protein [Haladaptatus salinisoli]|uniref:PKD domain-containing protein n=1 Tax=Haladaptatus salinisoli TaxID=2884876 RepID=UPI001D0AA913|nr:PKD domain-containing protein [Haladaptatus salinisoli]